MADAMPAVPDGVIAYLSVRGGDAAIDFYQRAFGATLILRNPAPDGRVMHARLAINNGLVMLSDDFPEYNKGTPMAPQPGQPTGTTLHLQVANCDALYAQATAAGAEPVMPPADMFWGDRYAQLRDPFGHRWSIGSPLAQQGAQSQ